MNNLTEKQLRVVAYLQGYLHGAMKGDLGILDEKLTIKQHNDLQEFLNKISKEKQYDDADKDYLNQMIEKYSPHLTYYK